ncbi:peptidase family m13 domain-containing protein [Ditylenchus destructor]|uniref:Peptidase family m13 domain-containing protein n=1 Tax=Ditylenchus destructor TaxID=166010 RepID=A0AAD4MI33_9BILA|nr:peptidase family m13 domain-containing protein [Ditylenchus destructor]
MARCFSYDLIFSLCFAQLAIYGNYVNAVPLAVGLNFTTTSGARGTILASDATVILEGVVQNFTNTDSASSLFNSVNTFDRIIPIENKVVEDDVGALSYPELSSSINFTLNPCDNFYRFVCQGWYNANVIEDGYTESSHRVVLTQLAFENINGRQNPRSVDLTPNGSLHGWQRIYIVSLTNYLVSVIKMLVRDDMMANNRFFAKDPTDWARRVQSFITVEFHMAMILNSTVTNFNDPTADFSQTTVGELQRTISPSIDWTYYMMSVLPEEIKGRFNGNIAAIPLLLIKQSALEAFDDLIRTLPDQVLSDYMDWKVILNELSWLDQRFLTATLLSQMGSEIGYPPSIFNDDQMRSMFDRLNISNEMSFPEMMKKVTTWQVRTQVLMLFDLPATDFKSSEANAFYDPTKNKMRKFNALQISSASHRFGNNSSYHSHVGE